MQHRHDETSFVSAQVLDMLEQRAVARDSMVPPPPLELDLDELPTNPNLEIPFELTERVLNIDDDPAVELVPIATDQRTVALRLAEAWTLIDDAKSALQHWQTLARQEVGMSALLVRLRQAQGLLDDVLYELEEEPADRTTMRP